MKQKITKNTEKAKKQICLRASSSSIWTKCAANALYKSESDIFKINTAADKGTLAHDLLARLVEGEKIDKKELKKTYENLDAEFISYAIEANSYLQTEIKLLKKNSKTFKTIIEQRYNYTVSGYTITGQPDVVLVADNNLYVYDFKTGRRRVEARKNSQLKIYAALTIIEQNKTFKNVVGTIIQPSLGVVEHSEIDLNSVSDAKKYLNSLIDSVKKLVKEKPQTGEHCRYCHHADICPALRAIRLKFLHPQFLGEIHNRPENWAEIIRYAKTLETLIANAKEYAKNALENGQKIHGLKLGFQSGHKKWVDNIDADKLSELLEKNKSELVSEKLLSPTEAIAKFGKEKLNGLYVHPRYNTVVAGSDGDDDNFFD